MHLSLEGNLGLKMYFEFKSFLRELVNQWLKSGNHPLDVVGNFQVLTPPENALAFVGSNITFSLARKIYIEPVKLSEQLAEFANQNQNSPFILLPTESGYLNARPKPSAIKDFFTCAPEKILKSEFLDFNADDVLSKIHNSENLDLKKLLKSKNNLDKADLQMALALLGDVELSVSPYLAGLKGKENIAWLLERFSEDWRKVSSSIEAKDLALRAPRILQNLTSNTLILKEPDNFSSFEGILRHQLLALLSIRNFDSLDRLFSFSLSLVHSFYAYYNLPYFRAELQSPTSELWPAMAQAVELIGLSVEEVSNAPFFSCGN